VGGSATLRGQDYVLGIEGDGGGMAIITFDGSVILPDFNSSGTAGRPGASPERHISS
jgi:hypothetical protein